KWLENAEYPLDWNGPTGRPFFEFGLDADPKLSADDRDRAIIHHFERVAHRHPDRVAITDSDTSVSYAQLWDGLSGLAETISAETKPGELIGILLPASPMFPLAILACLATGRPFVALDIHHPSN